MRVIILIVVATLMACSVMYISGNNNKVIDDKDRGLIIEDEPK